ncbi:Rpn family recombination-promoting nuclease/putative transposase, partial [Klebsiella pneumoniae]|uniref:Rpn family recombination-promoting nuclease/putative transposase n=1 Tax=Klebsiella pneumoniae TaxID=573 RepID=UPI00210A122F
MRDQQDGARQQHGGDKRCEPELLPRLESGSFLEDDLRPYYSDILYSLETTRGAGYVHVLIEHQSAPDKLMVTRLSSVDLPAPLGPTICQ